MSKIPGEFAMSVAIVRRWGRDLAVASPEGFAGGLAEGDEVEVVDAGRGIVFRRRSPKLTLEQMFTGRSDEACKRISS
jgi:antitoxin component of MazEF toxin-antitoxin module